MSTRQLFFQLYVKNESVCSSYFQEIISLFNVVYSGVSFIYLFKSSVYKLKTLYSILKFYTVSLCNTAALRGSYIQLLRIEMRNIFDKFQEFKWWIFQAYLRHFRFWKNQIFSPNSMQLLSSWRIESVGYFVCSVGLNLWGPLDEIKKRSVTIDT